MAVIKKFSEIEHLMPEVDYRQFGSPVSNVGDKIKSDSPVYAFVMSKNGKYIMSVCRIEFTITKRLLNTYLLLCSYASEYGDYIDYFSIENRVCENIKKTDWPFTEDEIGLRLDCNTLGENMCVYFGTEPSDINEVRTKSKDKTEKTVEVETVFV